ncbi:MAG: GNAT family N-acetyltransferase [Candidatus Hodarchaeales archaeon]
MTIHIKEVKTWKIFEDAWNKGVQHLYWYTSDRPFDYTKDKLKDIRSDFGEENNIFLIAKKDEELVGVLHVHFNEKCANFNRWLPAVALVKERDTIGQMLIQHALESLSRHNIKTLQFISVYSIENKDQHEWYSHLYRNNGFKLKKPAILLQLLVDLKIEQNLASSEKIKLVGEDKYSIDECVDFTLRSYNTTPDDKLIHGWDKNVTNPELIREMLIKVRNGKLGEYKPEYTLVAEIDNKPVGYIFSFVPDPQEGTRRGVIGNLGVFPAYRGKGISTILLKEMLTILKKNKCKCVQVGTPINNEKAIEAYKKVGFRPDSVIEIFYRKLGH